MSEWKDIESAPVGKMVRLGRWFGREKLAWVTEPGMAFKWVDGAFPWNKPKAVKTYDGTYYTHWMPLPEPPLASSDPE